MEPRWNLKPLQEDGRRRKFAAAIDEKLKIEKESNQSGVEKWNTRKKTITEVAEEQLMRKLIEIGKPWITEHIIALIKESIRIQDMKQKKYCIRS
jgi:hypothetical protein